MVSSLRRTCTLAGLLMALAPATHAQDAAAGYPNRPIHFIVAFPPGGGTDTVARLIGQQIAKNLEQPVVVENRGGGSGILAAQAVANAAPDGYTLMIGGSGPFVFNPIVNTKLPYDPETGLIPITVLATYPLVIAEKTDLEAKSLAEVLALARSRSVSLTYGSAGTTFQVPMEYFLSRAGVSMLMVPYRGGGPAAQALMGGETDLMVSDLNSIAHLHKAGRMRALAVTSLKRNPILPEVPTVAEAAKMPDFEASAFSAIAAPGGTPPAIVRKIQAAVVRALNDPEVLSRLTELGMEPGGISPEATAARIKSETALFRPIAQRLGLVDAK